MENGLFLWISIPNSPPQDARQHLPREFADEQVVRAAHSAYHDEELAKTQSGFLRTILSADDESGLERPSSGDASATGERGSAGAPATASPLVVGRKASPTSRLKGPNFGPKPGEGPGEGGGRTVGGSGGGGRPASGRREHSVSRVGEFCCEVWVVGKK